MAKSNADDSSMARVRTLSNASFDCTVKEERMPAVVRVSAGRRTREVPAHVVAGSTLSTNGELEMWYD